MKQDKVTMYTLAAELGVSPSAISRAFTPGTRISEEKRKMILEAAAKHHYQPNAMASRLSQNPIRIGALIVEHMAVYDREIEAGIRQAAEELRDYKVICDMRVQRPRPGYEPDTDIFAEYADAIATLDEFKKEKYDAVLVSKLPREILLEKVPELADSGIRTVIFDSDTPECKRLFVSMNNISIAAGMAADVLRMLCGSGKKVAVFNGGLQEELTACFEQKAWATGLEMVANTMITLGMDDEHNRENKRLVADVFSRFPDLAGIYVSCANCRPICEYLKEQNLVGKVRLVTSDIFEELKGYLMDGVIDASIYQDPFSQGHDAFTRLYYYLAEQQPVPEQLLSHPQLVMRSNVSLFHGVDNVYHK